MEEQNSKIGDLTVAQAAPVLEAEFRRRVGDEEYQRLYRTLDLLSSEWTIEQEQQLYNTIYVVGTAGSDRTTLFLCIIWLARKEANDPLTQQLLAITRQKTVRQLLEEARRAAQKNQ